MRSSGRALFGIVQGGDDPDSARSERPIAGMGIGSDGYAIGGLAVGEPQDVMLKVVAEAVPALPQDKPVISSASALQLICSR